MKLTDEQRKRIEAKMQETIKDVVVSDGELITMLAAGMRELALCKVDDAKRSNIQWPGSGDQSSIEAAWLKVFADDLEAK